LCGSLNRLLAGEFCPKTGTDQGRISTALLGPVDLSLLFRTRLLQFSETLGSVMADFVFLSN
jgi:hypothetical protein